MTGSIRQQREALGGRRRELRPNVGLSGAVLARLATASRQRPLTLHDALYTAISHSG
ncbi:hypothetical protein [Nocardia brevicatena]|uniref:hypothetical protein n=1 Tax=Nocardia brevicatena TaxID=37327 RepID=UPI0003026C5B|nr:hypothetical protein [Nocardia brevicatena]